MLSLFVLVFRRDSLLAFRRRSDILTTLFFFVFVTLLFRLLRRAIALDQDNVRALDLLGSAAFDRRDFSTALAYWRKVLTLVRADSELGRMEARNIRDAEAAAMAQGVSR